MILNLFGYTRTNFVTIQVPKKKTTELHREGHKEHRDVLMFKSLFVKNLKKISNNPIYAPKFSLWVSVLSSVFSVVFIRI